MRHTNPEEENAQDSATTHKSGQPHHGLLKPRSMTYEGESAREGVAGEKVHKTILFHFPRVVNKADSVIGVCSIDG